MVGSYEKNEHRKPAVLDLEMEAALKKEKRKVKKKMVWGMCVAMKERGLGKTSIQ